ncbi:MAG: glycosyltransferase 4 family protein [Candidatus Micrarchaeota archaeon]
MLVYLSVFAISFLICFLFTYLLIPRLRRVGISGKDINKPDAPEVAEMGGLAIVAGFSAGVLLAVFANSFFSFDFNLIFILAALITILAVAIIGIVDDLLDIPQWFKALLPLFAAVPLIAVNAAESTSILIPFIGPVDFGIFFLIVLIPIGVAVSSNLTNMFAGFNGLESSLGVVIFATVAILALTHGLTEMSILSIAIIGALLAFLVFNRYPSKIFPGDVGNLSIGAILASAVIIGNFEAAGALLLIPYIIDFFIKAYNKFPSSKWWGVPKDGKLYPVDGKVRGFAQLVMKRFNGISEQRLVLFFICLEILVAVAVLGFFFTN